MKTNRHHIILIVLVFIFGACSIETIRVSVNNTINIEALANCRLKHRGDALIVHKNLKADSKIIKVE